MKKSNYPTAQSVLYMTGRIIIGNCKGKLADFSAFDSQYTVPYLEGLLTELEAAEALPDLQARSLEHELKRIEMEEKGEDCRQLWQGLKRYIAKSLPEATWESNWEAAGWNDYAEAGNNNWDKVKALMQSGSTYIATYGGLLTHMPAGFGAEFNGAKDDFSVLFDAFTSAEVSAREKTDEKIEANNSIYRKIIEVCLDGQHIYAKDETRREEFVFEKMSELVKPAGASSVIATVRNGVNNQPMANATVRIRGVAYTTDAQGRVEKHQLAAGAAAIEVEADGFSDYQTTVDLETGTSKHLTVMMSPLVAEGMTPGAEVPAEETV